MSDTTGAMALKIKRYDLLRITNRDPIAVTMKNYPKKDITGIIIAGGQSKRMQYADKGLTKIHGKPMISYVINSLSKQVNNIIINSNSYIKEYQKFGYPVIADTMDNHQGPLAGIVSVLTVVETPYAMILPCDVPCCPTTLGPQLMNAMQHKNADVCVAHDGRRMQSLIMLLRCSIKTHMESYLASGQRKVETWILNQHYTTADFSQNHQWFFNVNTPDELAHLDKFIEENEHGS